MIYLIVRARIPLNSVIPTLILCNRSLSVSKPYSSPEPLLIITAIVNHNRGMESLSQVWHKNKRLSTQLVHLWFTYWQVGLLVLDLRFSREPRHIRALQALPSWHRVSQYITYTTLAYEIPERQITTAL